MKNKTIMNAEPVSMNDGEFQMIFGAAERLIDLDETQEAYLNLVRVIEGQFPANFNGTFRHIGDYARYYANGLIEILSTNYYGRKMIIGSPYDPAQYVDTSTIIGPGKEWHSLLSPQRGIDLMTLNQIRLAAGYRVSGQGGFITYMKKLAELKEKKTAKKLSPELYSSTRKALMSKVGLGLDTFVQSYFQPSRHGSRRRWLYGSSPVDYCSKSIRRTIASSDGYRYHDARGGYSGRDMSAYGFFFRSLDQEGALAIDTQMKEKLAHLSPYWAADGRAERELENHFSKLARVPPINLVILTMTSKKGGAYEPRLDMTSVETMAAGIISLLNEEVPEGSLIRRVLMKKGILPGEGDDVPDTQDDDEGNPGDEQGDDS